MKQTIKIKSLIVILAFAVFSTTQFAWAKVDYRPELFEQLAVSQNPIPTIKIPNYQRIILKNGMVVYLLEDHAVPSLTVNGYIRGGRSIETAETTGLTDFMTDMMNTGTKKYSETALERFKQMHALSFGLIAADHNFSFSGDALVSEKEALLSLAAEVLRRPNFKADYLQRLKNERQTSLAQMKTEEESLLNFHFYRNIFPNHLYSFGHDFELGLANLSQITPENLERWYQRTIAPNQTILLISGDLKTSAMTKLVQKYFGSWARQELNFTPAKAPENKAIYGRILLVDKPDATQAKIKLGYPFVSSDVFDQDLNERMAFQIGNQVFGGGDFESYLMDRIRTQKGYAYDISADYSTLPLGGVYEINTSVKPEKACETLETIKQMMQDLKTGKQTIGSTEVFKIINQWNAFFPESFRYPDAILNNLVYNVEIRNHNANWLNQYIQAYNTVTAAKAQAAFAKYAFPEKLFTVIVGKKEDILPQFKAKGIEVTVVK